MTHYFWATLYVLDRGEKITEKVEMVGTVYEKYLKNGAMMFNIVSQKGDKAMICPNIIMAC